MAEYIYLVTLQAGTFFLPQRTDANSTPKLSTGVQFATSKVVFSVSIMNVCGPDAGILDTLSLGLDSASVYDGHVFVLQMVCVT
jgi:hypothetical protein